MKTPEEMAEEWEQYMFIESFKQFYGATPDELLQLHNSRLPKDPKSAAIKHFINKFEGEKVDIPIASDSKGTLQYSRYKLSDFLREIYKQKE